MLLKRLFLLLFSLTALGCYAQDVEFHLNSHLLPGKNILKVKRDFNDPYLWVLAQGNEVYRVNSLTLSVENYSSQFAAYNNLKFIDIAGRSQDTVFIATKSTNVIEYKKGIVKVIGPADGVSTEVNSVGIPKRREFESDQYTLLIGSDHGTYTYDMLNERMLFIQHQSASQVYDATYRNFLYKDSTATYPDWDGRKYVPVFAYGEGTTFGLYLTESDIIGHNINTAHEIFGSMYDYDMRVSYTGLFWGTRNGMFQFNGDESYYINRDYGHYLDGINVNKITSMFGLTAFGSGWWNGDGRLIKQTMLIGTDKGLYFSNSVYQTYDPQLPGLKQVTLFHFDLLGNTIINDVCVNTASKIEPVCDDGVWVAAQDGLYLLKPDYGKYLTAQSINAVQFDGIDASVSEMQICSGSSITASVNTTVYTGHTIQWYKNGTELPGESGNKLIITSAGNYSAVVYDPCENLHLNSNTLKVDVITSPTVTLNYPDENFYCEGSNATFKVDDNPNYQYRWYTDGELNGNTSNSITVSQNGNYKVEVSACSGVWVASKEIKVGFINLPSPTLQGNKTSYCIGDQATISTNIQPDPSYTINWYRDGAPLIGNTNQTSFTTDIAGNYQIELASNKITCTQLSATLPIVFNLLPTITLEKIINTSLCSGQTVDLQATISAGTIKWSTGETSSRISVKNSGDYSAVVTSPSGCSDNKSINVQFFSNPVLNLQDAMLCPFNQEQITLSAPPGFAKYLWNGQPGSDTFTTGSLGKVELTVTDQNNCTATQTINITSHCTDIRMANTFTPNADGANDTWIIEGLDASATVKVYNRYGSIVFNSHGYPEPWDGTYKGGRLPAGTYYYIINAKAGAQVLSGWVSIIY
ncbi:gliding motility-associated C-terminal domain-containing protein [Mucilaginibacter endophyticus]|uniref:gliding motility-associated C-terminal domain-containing protein n=1 Tax=Mucilaginibacter endophyticus TaxID=2675003 RepID=UPI000E0DBA8D|nr:gliding motility-associated C-terminal domain-containing protein [Mucilaginibacter endophyticus]